MANKFTEIMRKHIAEIKGLTDSEAEREYMQLVKDRRINVEAWG